MTQEETEIVLNFRAATNMTPDELESWLQTEKSQQVRQPDQDNSSGKRTIELLRKEESEYTSSDFAYMKHAIFFIREKSRERPSGSIRETSWRYCLMNWGHDPTKG
ncbi:MAG: DUF3140 domain-containing protein [Elainellaceae cyanobacterium]